MKKMRKNVIATMALSSALLVSVGLGYTLRASAEETNELASLTMLGAQLRVDGTDGMRFVMAMDEADYEKYSANEKLSVGVLIMPSNLIGADGVLDINDVNDVDGALNVAFAKDYKANLIDGTYRFNAVLTGIESQNYTRDVMAVGYVADASGDEVVYTYTSAIERDITQVASVNLSDYDEETQADKYSAVSQYIVTAFNQARGTEYATLDDLVAAEPLTLTMEGNEIACIMINNQVVAGYDNILSCNLADIFEISYSTESKNITVGDNGEVSATGTQAYDTEKGRGAATVTATALGGKLSASFDLTVIDEVIWDNEYGKVGSAWNNYNHEVDADDSAAVTENQNQLKNFLTGNLYCSNSTNFNTNTQSNANYIVNGDKGYYGAEDKAFIASGVENGFLQAGEQVFAYQNANGKQTYRPRLVYTKEQIAYLMVQGYDRVVLPAYMELDTSNISASSFPAGLTRMDLWTVNQDLKTITEEPGVRRYGFYGSSYSTTVNKVTGYSNSAFYFNEWQNITISLQVIYDNYEKFDYSTNANKTEPWAMFSLLLTDYQNADLTSLGGTLYLGDMRVAKDTFVDEDTVNGKYYIDYTNPDILNKITFATKGSANATKYNDFYYQTVGEKGVYTGTVAGREGTFLALSNVDYASAGYGGAMYKGKLATNGPLTYSCLFLGSVITKDKLQELSDNGYESLEISVAYTREATAKYTTKLATAPAVRSNYYKVSGNLVTTTLTDGWVTYSIPVSELLTNFDTYFNDLTYNQNSTGTAGTAWHRDLLQFNSLSNASQWAITNIFIDGLAFVK